MLSPPTVHVVFNGANGAIPYDEMTYDAGSGRFYGTTERGGVNNQGTIFSYVLGASMVTTLRENFSGHFGVRGPLVVSGGFIYGALGYNFFGNGAIFRMGTDGSGFTIIHTFTQFSQSANSLTLGADGKLYGVTPYGGIVCDPNDTYGCGTVFRLRAVLPGDTDTQFETLYQMQNHFDAGPQRSVVYGSDGLIYFNHHRRIYRLDPNNPAATFQMIWDEPGGSVSMSIIEGADNRLYVAAYDNQQSGAGSVFSLNRDGSDRQILRLFSFMTGLTAYGPYGRLHRTASGVIYGTTEYTILGNEYGTVFAIGAGSNSPPVLSNVAATSPVTEGGSTTLSGNISDADANDSFTLTVNWGDGSAPQIFNYPAGTTLFTETHQYLDDNPSGTPSDNYTINLTLADNNGSSDTASTIVTVNNAPPVLSNVSANPAIITVGQATSLSGFVNDAGTFDPHDITISWGDGSPDTVLNLGAGVNSFNMIHQYNSPGAFNIAITATDDDTGSTNANTNVTVISQQPPVLSNVAVSSPIAENGVAILTGNISDPNAGDTFVLTVNWGDGSPVQMFNYPAGTTFFSETHQFLDDNPTGTPSDNYTINLILNDNVGGSDTDSAVLTVNNLPPVLGGILANPSTISIGGTTNLSGAITDVGTLDTQQIVINWGDGTPTTTLNLAAGVNSFNANHQYNSAGIFNIAVTATDDDNGIATGGASVTVNQNQSSGGKIAFASNRDGNYEIYLMNPDGSNQTRLTNNSAFDYFPAISPDGNRIAFSSFRDGNHEIYVMNSDGTGQTRLTNHPDVDSQPSFSPDGSRIVFISYRHGNYEIYVMNADGNNPKRLTDNPAPDHEPVFSPDGTKIAFTSNRHGNGQVYLMDADGSNQIRLTNTVTDEYDPSFSPDGNRIAFTSFRHGATNEIYTMNATDGSNQTRLTNNAAGDISPSFSPDGNRIAFVSDRDGRLEVYVMNANGSGQTRLTDNPEGNEQPSWSVLPNPAGGKIVFASFRNGNSEIYSMNSSGTNQTRLTNNASYEAQPMFSPDGSRIVFTSDRNGGIFEIYAMNADGSNQIRLTNSGGLDASFSPDGSRIAFRSFRDGNAEIYVMNADGSNQTRLTHNPAIDFESSFSPDGIRLVFTSNRNGNMEIYLMNPDGANQTPLTNNAAVDHEASFSPDGSQIAFTSFRNGNEQIYVMNANGTNQTRVSNNAVADFSSSWGKVPPSAPGRKIVFHSARDGNYEVYTMNSNGTNQTRLTNNAAFDGEAAFSPDGSRIAFVSDRDGNSEIYIMNPDGTGQTRLTNNAAGNSEPSFSPDGSRIVFVSYRNNNAEIYVMNTDGTNQTRLTNNPAADLNPTFSPDGNLIAFYSERNIAGIYLMNANGRSNPARLTDGSEPSFSPDGNRIAYTFGGGVFVINTNGKGKTRLTGESSLNFDPSFSPDGSRIAFESFRDGNFQIYLMNTDGSHQTRLTDNTAGDFSPSWGDLVLAAPTNLTATAVSPTQINLAWTDNSTGEDGFLIERCEGNGKCTVFIPIAGTSANITAFANTGLKPFTFYNYRVRAFSTGGDSPYSNRARDKTPKP